tara:strand:+ start:3167 stop:3412 length:246 start_codon:yes stop_codon:yes gene_type:complete
MDRNYEAYPDKAGYIQIEDNRSKDLLIYKVDNIRSYAKFHFRGENTVRANIYIPNIRPLPNYEKHKIQNLTYPYPDLYKEI